MMPDPREARGRLVRRVFTEWAFEQQAPKDSWLLTWSEIDDGQREVDMRIGAAVARPFEDLLTSIWLYANWQWLTEQLTTEQKELWADAIDSFHARASEKDPTYGDALPADRWWRDGRPARDHVREDRDRQSPRCTPRTTGR